MSLPSTPTRRTVEIRSYALKPGREAEFERVFREQAAPMLARWSVEVVAFGRSLEAPGAYLIRAYDSLEQRQQSQDAFYGSPEWRQGPREAILDCMDSYQDTVLSLDPAAVEALRTSLA